MRQTLIVILALVAVAVTGCDEAVDPLVGGERPFTLWGYLDAESDTQRVLVVPIRDRIGLLDADLIDASFVSVDRQSGERRVWSEEIVAYEDGTYGHVFWSAFRATPTRTYHIEVTRSDGAASWVELTMPPPVSLVLDPDPVAATLQARFDGTVPNFVGVRAVYEASTVPPTNPWPPGSPTPPLYRMPVEIDYTGEVEQSGDGWRLQIDMAQDFTRIQDVFELNCLQKERIAVRLVSLSAVVGDDQWRPPGGVFDPEVLVEPGVFSNVENGYGFVGGGFVLEDAWIPPVASLRLAGFRFEPPCLMMARDVPECQMPPEPCFRDEQR